MSDRPYEAAEYIIQNLKLRANLYGSESSEAVSYCKEVVQQASEQANSLFH